MIIIKTIIQSNICPFFLPNFFSSKEVKKCLNNEKRKPIAIKRKITTNPL